VFTVLALVHRLCPQSANLTPTEGLLRCVAGARPVPLPEHAAALCNSFGFGGTNASVLFATPSL